MARELGFEQKEGTSKPDAILIHTESGEYLIAEFKILSSKFDENHHKDDVDVLICWEDEAVNRDELPPVVVELQSVALSAAIAGFLE